MLPGQGGGGGVGLRGVRVVGGVAQLVEQARGGGVVAAPRRQDQALARALFLRALRAAAGAQALRTTTCLSTLMLLLW